MSDIIAETMVEVLGKTFQIKCAESQISSLQKASHYLDEKMRYFRQQGIIEFEKVAVIAALNVVHQLLSHEAQKEIHMQTINQRLHDLKNKVDNALQLELQAIE
jgi:cell division protein ZapA